MMPEASVNTPMKMPRPMANWCGLRPFNQLFTEPLMATLSSVSVAGDVFVLIALPTLVGSRCPGRLQNSGQNASMGSVRRLSQILLVSMALITAGSVAAWIAVGRLAVEDSIETAKVLAETTAASLTVLALEKEA